MEDLGKPQPENMGDMLQGPTKIEALKIEISKDNMSAYLVVDVTGVNLRDFSPTIIYEVINNSKLSEDMINYTVIKDIVTDVSQKKKEVQPITAITNPEDNYVRTKIATGIDMIPGLDGWVKFYHPHNQRVVIRPDGSADYRNLEKYISIKQEDKIATLFAGVPGKQGKNVFGETLNPPSIKRPKIVIGTNITMNQYSSPEEPEKVFIDYSAACDGVLFSTDESVSVSPELRIEGNAGLTTGNINYKGTITVNGTIEDGTDIRCEGALNVAEVLESTNIEVGGDLNVKGGIKPKSKKVISIGGSIKTKFIENSNLEVRGDVIVEGYILNSTIRCLGSVILTGQTGTILNSNISVMGGLSTVNLGSNAGLDVDVELGVHFINERLFHEFTDKLKLSEKEMTALIPQVQQANNIIKQSRGKLDLDKKRKYAELFALFKEKSAIHKEITDKLEELKSTRFNQDSINIVVKGAAYPGCVIKYRRQIEKISVNQSAFMMTFSPGQDSAPMTAINSKKK